MDLQTLRNIVDGSAPNIHACENNLERLYDYVGLERGSSYTRETVSKALYAKINGSFTSGHSTVWRTCKALQKELIRENVLSGGVIDPYFEVLDHLRDAVRTEDDSRALIEGDWELAIRSAFDHVQLQSWGVETRKIIHARDFMVAEAALTLRNAGFSILFEQGKLSLEEASETALVAAIEELVTTIGGINVARRIFKSISHHYDSDQERYHVVRRTPSTGMSLPDIPWGYLIQLAVKHVQGRKPFSNNDAQWEKLCGLAQAYAAVIDVQPYSPTFYGQMDAIDLVPYLQEMALYDTLFRIPQLRPRDITKIARGMLSWLDMSKPTKSGWSVDQVLEIISYLFNSSRSLRGPIFFEETDVRRACPGIPREIVTQILDSVLSHPIAGANQNFSRPTDAPTPEAKAAGHDFFLRPLIRSSGRRFLLLDLSVCAPACLEALLTPLRSETKGLDEKVGVAVEDFLREEFISHGVHVSGGDYDACGQHGECDLVIETPDIVIFAEVKKKTLTRRAKAGSDAQVLLDLAGSLLAAQAQAGWHEVRLRKDGQLDLECGGDIATLQLKGREVERVAVSLFDFGSFQDRILLKQFLEATMNVTFTPSVANLTKSFEEINKSLNEIGEQLLALHPGERQLNQPFFHCWFISVPQLLILLDDVTDSAGFKASLWSCRHIATGSSDLYHDHAYVRRLKREAAAKLVKPEMS